MPDNLSQFLNCIINLHDRSLPAIRFNEQPGCSPYWEHGCGYAEIYYGQLLLSVRYQVGDDWEVVDALTREIHQQLTGILNGLLRDDNGLVNVEPQRSSTLDYPNDRKRDDSGAMTCSQ